MHAKAAHCDFCLMFWVHATPFVLWAHFQVAPEIKEGMVRNGSLLIGYTPLKQKGYVNFFRIIIQNKLCEFKDMDYVVKEIDRLGKHLKV